MAANFRVKIFEISPLTFMPWHSKTDWNIAIAISLCENLVRFGPVTPEYKRGKGVQPPHRSADTAAISTEFCFTCSLWGITAMPRGLGSAALF